MSTTLHRLELKDGIIHGYMVAESVEYNVLQIPYKENVQSLCTIELHKGALQDVIAFINRSLV